MSTLYELTADYQQLLALGDSDDPEEQQAFLDTLEGLMGEIELKADDYAVVLSEFTAQADKIDTEIKRLTAKKKAIEGAVAAMKDRIKDTMVAMDKKEIKTDLHTFKIQNNGGKAPIVYDGEVPDSYKRVVYENDTEKIRGDLEDGFTLEFAHLGDRGTHLRIK